MKEGHSFAADTALQIPWDISGMRLGRGYAIEEGQVRQSALNIFQVINPDHEPNIKYEYISIDNEDEMQREINSSLNASASVFGIGIKAAFEQLQDIKCSSRSMTTILRCTIVSGPFQYDKDPTFSQEAMTLLQAQPPKIDQFLATYGSYFVAGYQKTSSLSAISTYNATDKDSLNKFKGDLNVGKGIASVNAVAGYRETAKKTQCSVQNNLAKHWHHPNVSCNRPLARDDNRHIPKIYHMQTTASNRTARALFSHQQSCAALAHWIVRIRKDQENHDGCATRPEQAARMFV